MFKKESRTEISKAEDPQNDSKTDFSTIKDEKPK